MQKNVPFVLALGADAFGCGHHRMIWPSKWIAQNGIALSNFILGNVPTDQILESKPTTIVFQRQVEKHQVESIKRMRETLGEGAERPNFVWEIDDLITDVPFDSVHEPFQAPAKDVTKNIHEVLGYVDWATVPTEPLAEWLRQIRPGTEVRVIPNLLEELDSDELPKIESAAPSPSVKLKISWAGGISHAGDLKLIEMALRELANENIKWSFMGLKPEGNFGKADISFHAGVAPQDFMKTYIEQGHELVLAPLEVHPFNEAKSNLRLIQAGAAGAAVIASPAYPYKDKNPPVFAYCSTPEEWLEAIRRWIALSGDERLRWRKKMRNWARAWGVKPNLANLAHAWGLEVPKPIMLGAPKNNIVVAEREENVWISQEDKAKLLFEPDIEKANTLAVSEDAPLLLVRPGTVFGKGSLAKMHQFLRQSGAASVCGLSNDGVFGFDFLSNPQSPQFSVIDRDLNNTIDATVGSTKLSPKVVPVPLGPAILVSPEKLSKMPIGNSAFDWGLLQTYSGGKNVLLGDVWNFASQTEQNVSQAWLNMRRINIQETKTAFPPEERLIVEARCAHNQKIYTAPGAPNDISAWKEIHNKGTIQASSVAVLNLGDQDGLEKAQKFETKWLLWKIPSVKMFDGADGDLELCGDAKSADVVYCDAIGPQNSSCFRPKSFDREWFKAWDYISGCCLVKTELWAWGAPVGRGEIFKRLLEISRDDRKFVHCPKVLCEETDTPDDEGRIQSVREVFPDFSAKPYIKGLIEVKKKLQGAPSVNIIMLTSGDTWVLRPGLATLLRRTEYKGAWNVIVGRSGPKKGNAEDLVEISDPRVTYKDFGETEPFNWSKLNNDLARTYADADYLVFINDDCRVLDKSWLEDMIAYAQIEDAGYVGIRLVYPADGSVQHVGVYCNSGHTGHIMKQWQGAAPGYWGYTRATHECMAVTGACIAINRKKFTDLGMLPEEYAYNFGDVSACLNANRAGLRNICVCPTEMQHAESATRPAFNDTKGLKLLREEGNLLRKQYPEEDLYWNENLKIAVHPNQLMANGFNFEILNWDMEEISEKCILLLNTVEPEEIIKNTYKNTKVLVGVAEHGRLMMVKPGLANAPALELQNKTLIGMVLGELGVTEIVEAKQTIESQYIKSCLR